MVRRWLPLIVMMALAGCGELPNAALDLGVVTPSDSGSSAPDAPTPPSPPPSQRISDLPCQPFTAKSEKAGSVSGDPVNVVLIGSEAAVTGCITRAGWIKADPITVETAARIAEATLFDTSYPNAPLSLLYLFGRSQDVGYEMNSQHVRRRDHFRLWKTETKDPGGRQTWAVAATRDIGIRVIKGPTHIIGPQIDMERNYVAKTLEQTRMVVDRYVIPGIGHPYHGKNGEGDPYQTDGMTEVLVMGS